MKCNKCDTENTNDAVVCQQCGKLLYKKIFISHHKEDKSKANALRELLIKVTRIENHFCSSNPGSIKYGEDWYKKIIEELDNSHYIICLLTKKSYQQPWILYEAGIAKGKDETKKIISLLFDISGNQLNTSPFNINQYCIDDENDENLFALMKQIYEDFHPVVNKLCKPIEESIKRDIQEFKKKMQKEKPKKVLSKKNKINII
jgi:hypothetical protein